MSRRHPATLPHFERRSLLLIASLTLGVAGGAFAQGTASSGPPPAGTLPAASASTGSGTSAASIDTKAAFAKTDTNGDGRLSREEAASLPAVSANFDKADGNKDGFLSSVEFANALKM